jgi:hypothetical protein
MKRTKSIIFSLTILTLLGCSKKQSLDPIYHGKWVSENSENVTLWELTGNELNEFDGTYTSKIKIDYGDHPIRFDTYGVNHGDDYQGIIEFISSNEFRVAQSRKERPHSFSHARTNDIVNFVRLESKKPKEKSATVPLPFSFKEPTINDEGYILIRRMSNGCGDFLVRRINPEETAVIYLRVDLKDENGNFKPEFADTSKPTSLIIDATQRDAEVWIEEFQFFDSFQWNHYREQSAQTDYWKAISGTITFHTTQTKHSGYYVDAHLSNIVFQSSYSTDLTELNSISFTNVYVGWYVM